jgi:hypothetical protein
VRVDYRGLVDQRKLSHSGDPVGVLLERLGGRSLPAEGERREDALAYRLLDPLLEPYAFVLVDAMDSLSPAPDPPMVEVGSLWEPGEEQPAWVELVRARRFVLESDGQGKLRAFLPAPSGEDPVEAAKQAWSDAWPVLRHALAGERRRLARRRGGDLPSLDVEVHAYRHRLAESAFDLGVTAWRASVTDTRPTGDRPPVDLAGLRSILARGFQIEGARLEPSGRIRWFTSEAETKPSILGRAPTLADLAIAYRAVARGGYGEPYMSLDRAPAPHVAYVNYGGRLRDTSLGMVSLLADVRFKTFSVGIDLLGDGDVREAVRRAVPGFQTHLESFASDPTAGAVLNQQTRFWFYPDDVDLTLSAEGDVLAFRKVRMTAASERVRDGGAASAEAPWTKATVAFLNAHYDALATRFPEMSDLDESVRLLSLFTWLSAARARGLTVPDLDALLALDLPQLSTPRRFPQLLTHDVLSPPAAVGVVDVLDRTDVGDALARLETRSAEPLPAPARLERDRLLLNPQIPEQAELAAEIGRSKAGASDYDQDLLSYRAERLLMHARVLATIPAERRSAVDARRKQAPATRVFSVGIGGVDLGMSAVLARAAARTARLGLAAGGKVEPKSVERAAPPAAVTLSDPGELPQTLWPDHGLGAASERVVTTLPESEGTIVARRLAGALVRQGTFKPQGGPALSWDEVLSGMEGPELRTRRRIADAAAKSSLFERVEEGRFLRYRFDRVEGALRAQPASGGLPLRALLTVTAPPTIASTLPAELTVMDLLAPDTADPASPRVRLSDAGGHERAASVPRSLLQRLVRGREVDLTPDRPLQAFTPPSAMLGTSKTLMVLQSADESRPPWSGPATPLPGEEDAVRLASALTRWWSAEPAPAAHAVVGSSPLASPGRWAVAPRLDGTLSVLDPDTLLPTQGASPGATVVLLVSAEPPGVLGKRLRLLATDPALSGKILAVAALGGPLRPDLPASLLGDGKLAALGVYEVGPVGRSRALSDIAAFQRTLASEASKGRRVDDVSGPFTWYY